jgi:hypothetical protein
MSKLQRPHLLGLNPISGHSFLGPPWGLLSHAQPQGSFSLDKTAHFPGRANEHLQPRFERNRAMRASLEIVPLVLCHLLRTRISRPAVRQLLAALL